MKAIVRTKYGPPDALQFIEVEKPTANDNEVLIKVRAASVNPLDLFTMRGAPLLRLIPGVRTPKDQRIGVDVAGQVETAGRNVTQLKPGDEVFGVARGAFAEYACATEDKLALKPANISFEDAAAVPVAAITVLQGLRDKGQIRLGQKVLVDGRLVVWVRLRCRLRSHSRPKSLPCVAPGMWTRHGRLAQIT
jgi:NADPH:quinone reductase-like Zn-dependent oxidoreductase